MITSIRWNVETVGLGGTTMETAALTELAASIVAAYVSKNSVQVSDLPNLISNVYQSLATLGQPQATAETPADLKPAVPVKKSVTPDYIVCLEDGKKLKMLKRHLKSSYGPCLSG